MSYEEYIPKPKNRIWKLCRSLALILAVLMFVYYLGAIDNPPALFAIYWALFGVPLLLLGSAFKTDYFIVQESL